MPTFHPLIKSPEKPTVLIVGAGLGGLTLAVLLERAEVPYQLFERATEAKPLGAALSLGGNVAPLFRQLGIFEEFVAISKVSLSNDGYSEERQHEYSVSLKAATEMGGCPYHFVTRAALHDLLLSKVPAEKIPLGKRVLSMRQNEHGVRIEFSDNSAVDGDILVGADGAYSGVRQSLYKQLKKDGKLSTSDDGALPFSCVCLVGTTKPLDPAQYPEFLLSYSRLHNVIGNNKPYSWSTITMNNNVYSWTVIQYLDKETSKDNDSFRNSEWGPEAAEAMSNDVRNFPVPGGLNNDLTLGDLIDETPYVSKVMLEEKIFDTWYHGRTVLIGDACHKIHPASGAGAVVAMHDAVALANWISVLDSTTVEATEKIFKEYKAERHPAAVSAFNAGRTVTAVIGTDMKSKIARYITRNMPDWLYKWGFKSILVNRPQVSFLPLVKDEGTLTPKYQPSLEKTLAVRMAKTAAPSQATTAAAI